VHSAARSVFHIAALDFDDQMGESMFVRQLDEPLVYIACVEVQHFQIARHRTTDGA
jgi:hypothetical protein